MFLILYTSRFENKCVHLLCKFETPIIEIRELNNVNHIFTFSISMQINFYQKMKQVRGHNGKNHLMSTVWMRSFFNTVSWQSRFLWCVCSKQFYFHSAWELDSLQIPMGGDQLTRERFQGAKSLRAGTHTRQERFEQLYPMIMELFHTLQDFLEVTMINQHLIWSHCQSKCI